MVILTDKDADRIASVFRDQINELINEKAECVKVYEKFLNKTLDEKEYEIIKGIESTTGCSYDTFFEKYTGKLRSKISEVQEYLTLLMCGSEDIEDECQAGTEHSYRRFLSRQWNSEGTLKD